MTRTQLKRWTMAYSIAQQIVNGTLPDDGVIACETPEAACALLADIDACVKVLSRETRI